MTTTPSISHYTGLLHSHGVGSTQAKAYREKHALDETFQHRCSVMDQVFQLAQDMKGTEGRGHGPESDEASPEQQEES